jgi:hypothetical protein
MKVVTPGRAGGGAFQRSACDHAYVSGEEDAKNGPKLFALTEELVLRRARRSALRSTGSRDLMKYLFPQCPAKLA